MEYVVIDLETTGLDPTHHEICEMSFIVIDEELKEVAKFTSTMMPEHFSRIDPKALRVNGFTEKELKTHPSIVQVRGAFLRWKQEVMGDDLIIPIGHNIGFDLEFLRVFLQYQYEDIFHYRKCDTKVMIDNLKLINIITNESPSGLNYWADKLNIPYTPHKAYEDCMAVIGLLKWFKKSISLNLDNILED